MVQLDAQAARVGAGLDDLSGLKYGFPPLAVALGFLPGDQVTLSILSALFSGYLVQTLISWGWVRHNPR